MPLAIARKLPENTHKSRVFFRVWRVARVTVADSRVMGHGSLGLGRKHLGPPKIGFWLPYMDDRTSGRVGSVSRFTGSHKRVMWVAGHGLHDRSSWVPPIVDPPEDQPKIASLAPPVTTLQRIGSSGFRVFPVRRIPRLPALSLSLSESLSLSL